MPPPDWLTDAPPYEALLAFRVSVSLRSFLTSVEQSGSPAVEPHEGDLHDDKEDAGGGEEATRGFDHMCVSTAESPRLHGGGRSSWAVTSVLTNEQSR